MLQKTRERDQEIYVMFDTDGCIKVSYCSKNTPQTEIKKEMSNTFKDFFILDCI